MYPAKNKCSQSPIKNNNALSDEHYMSLVIKLQIYVCILTERKIDSTRHFYRVRVFIVIVGKK